MGILAGATKDRCMNSRENDGYLPYDAFDLNCQDLSITQYRQKTSLKKPQITDSGRFHFMGVWQFGKKMAKFIVFQDFVPVYPVSSTKAVVPGILCSMVQFSWSRFKSPGILKKTNGLSRIPLGAPE